MSWTLVRKRTFLKVYCSFMISTVVLPSSPLARYSAGMRLMFETIRQSAQALGLLIFLLSMSVSGAPTAIE